MKIDGVEFRSIDDLNICLRPTCIFYFAKAVCVGKCSYLFTFIKNIHNEIIEIPGRLVCFQPR